MRAGTSHIPSRIQHAREAAQAYRLGHALAMEDARCFARPAAKARNLARAAECRRAAANALRRARAMEARTGAEATP
jgi:hypothetical protein